MKLQATRNKNPIYDEQSEDIDKCETQSESQSDSLECSSASSGLVEEANNDDFVSISSDTSSDEAEDTPYRRRLFVSVNNVDSPRRLSIRLSGL